MQSLTNYYKYLPVSREDENWGLCVLNAGCSRILPNETYPSAGHPSHHNFDWAQGRILHDEYQVIYITRGRGKFESEQSGLVPVRAGMAILLFPGVWHRFMPDPDSGWDEYWVGFHGRVLDQLMDGAYFPPHQAVCTIGINEELLLTFERILEQTRHEKPGYQPLISGAVLYMLGQLYAQTKRVSFPSTDHIEDIVGKAIILFREQVEQNISAESIAQQLQVGYSWFRKVFKTYTGIAPGQYLIQLKVEKAKALLMDQDKSIKQIAFALHFDSGFYFSRLFKLKTGLSPEKYREGMRTTLKQLPL